MGFYLNKNRLSMFKQLFSLSKRTFSTTNVHLKYKDQPQYSRRKFLTTENWPKIKVDNEDEKMWLSSLPQTKRPDEWTRKEAYFGRYDFVSMLGNDVTLQPEVMAKGAKYVRLHNETELKRLLRKKGMHGQNMYLEDLDNISKRIRWLKTKVNRKMISKEKADFAVHGIKNPKKKWRVQG